MWFGFRTRSFGFLSSGNVKVRLVFILFDQPRASGLNKKSLCYYTTCKYDI